MLTYGSICSGIEGASVAWEPLGWRPLWFSEIDPFASAVLKHHYPAVRNLGDFTRIGRDVAAERPDVLVGGTPCQSFSVAGLRAGLADPRGNLALEFLALVDRLRPRWVAWENVPGALSSLSHDAPDPCPPPPPLDLECDGAEVETTDEYDAEELHALNCFVAGLSELGYGWAMRVLDAQYTGIPQRRRRIFVIGHFGGAWQRAAAVLFERHSLSGHPPPRRTSGQRTATSVIKGAAIGRQPDNGPQYGEVLTDGSCYTLNCTEQHAVGVLPFTPVGHGKYAPGVGCLRAEGADAEGGSETLVVPIAGCLTTRYGAQSGQDLDAGDLLVTDAAPLARCVTAGEGSRYDYETTTMVATVYPIQDGAMAVEKAQGGVGVPTPTDPMYTLDTNGAHAIAFDWQSGGDVQTNVSTRHTSALQACQVPAVQNLMQVRRLTPAECEALQGFPRDYTLVPYRGKPAADGPRYRALGNSFAVPVVQWIGQRIQMVETLVPLEVDSRAAG